MRVRTCEKHVTGKQPLVSATKSSQTNDIVFNDIVFVCVCAFQLQI